MDIKFKVSEASAVIKRATVAGVVKDWNTVKVGKHIVPINECSKSVRGCNILYIVDTSKVLKEYMPCNEASYTKLVSNRKYDGENENFRPYRPGLEVEGYMSDTFTIINIKHKEYGIETN